MERKKVTVVASLIVLILFGSGPASFADGLMDKVFSNDIAGAEKLLSAGADVNERDESYGSTPLLMACSYEGYTDMVKLLLAHGADPNIQDKVYGSTALIAAAGVSKEVVELLLEHGADIAIKRFDGTSAFTACITGILSKRVATDLASLLLTEGANVNEAPVSGPAQGYTCLMMAARNNRADLVEYLVSHGADVQAKAKDGSTALSLATKEKNAEMIKLLKKLGAK
jgi:ankyrin repeat protein